MKKVIRCPRHADKEWIYKKIGTHGGSFRYNSYSGLAHIGYIGGKNRLQILLYNIILYLKYIKRRVFHA